MPSVIERVFQGEAVDYPPVWMMRQAGRYMPEYQAVRGQVDFMTLCKTPDLAVEVSLQPWRAFGMDAVIMFSDILIPVEAMGVPVHFEEHRGPVLPQPLRHTDQLPRLVKPDPEATMGFVPEILRRLRNELANSPNTALIGFSGAPWTLASYMIEGGTSKQHQHIRHWLYEAPDTMHQLLSHITEVVIDYLKAQVSAGAQVIQLFDTWAGMLNPIQYEQFILPYHQRIFAALPADLPTLLYVQHSPHVIGLMAQSGSKGLSIDWLTNLREARQLVGSDLIVQGNLDPVALFSQSPMLLHAVDEVLAAGMAQGNRYIFNLGHGVLPKTPVDHVRQVVQHVQARRYALASHSV